MDVGACRRVEGRWHPVDDGRVNFLTETQVWVDLAYPSVGGEGQGGCDAGLVQEVQMDITRERVPGDASDGERRGGCSYPDGVSVQGSFEGCGSP